MKSTELKAFKTNILCISLDDSIILEIMDSFNQSNIKTNKVVKKQINILKNNKIQIKKDLIENKLIMIMNKLSHNNLNELVKEYLENIMITTEEEYIIIQEEILLKMLKDITFINNYIPFVIKIFSIEKYKLSIEPIHFINSIYKIISSHYFNNNNNNENYRISCLVLIKKLILFNFFKDTLLHDMSIILLNQNLYKVDVFYWFNDMPLLVEKYKDNIIENINYCKLNSMTREELMIDSICSNTIDSMNTVVNTDVNTAVNTIVEDPFHNIIYNIIEEYLYLGIVEEVILFVNNECKDINQKNIFSRELIKSYIVEASKTKNNTDIDKKQSILKLFDQLIKNRVLLKSHISKGLLLYLENNNMNNHMEGFLKFLKLCNITKNIEHVFKKFKIKINEFN